MTQNVLFFKGTSIYDNFSIDLVKIRFKITRKFLCLRVARIKVYIFLVYFDNFVDDD